MRIAQVFDRDVQIAAREIFQREVQVVVGHLDGDVHRVEVAIIDRARDQHLVGDHRHFRAELTLALGRESRRQRRIEERIVALGCERHVGRNDFLDRAATPRGSV